MVQFNRNMKKINFPLIILLILALLPSPKVQSQGGQTDWWYFGAQAGVHFNTSPTAVTNGALATQEGVATISDVNGTLLFYSDGVTVYNANHSTMTNGTGLLGGGSSAQSGVVVPRPGSSTEYYLFTVSPYGSNNGLRYSHIDMAASSGLGAVTNSQKNVWMMDQPTEKIAVVPKQGGYWVICPKHTTDTIYAFAVSSAGVSSAPVTGSTGVYTANPAGSVSYLKPNIAGTRLVGGSYSANLIALYDFNKNTGLATNGFTFTGGSAQYANYGVEFSPNGNLVYAQGWGIGNTRQYDITAGTAAQISASVTNLGPNSSGGGAIQLGRDGKLYVSRYGQTYLDCINNPDVQGTGCSYTTSAVSLSGRSCRWGLPTFIQAFFGASLEVSDNCFGDTTYFSADTTNVDSIYWDFGDTASGVDNYATGVIEVGHLYTDTGTYEVTLVVYNGSLTDTVVEEVFIYPRQVADFGVAETTLCVGLEFTLDVDQEFATFEWHDASTGATYTVTYPDSLVMVTVFGQCDTVSDTLIINFVYPFVLDIQNDTSICTYSNLNLHTDLPTSQYSHIWSNGSTQNNITIDTAGTYMVTVTEGICTYADTIVITLYPEVKVELGNDSNFCYEPLVTLTPKTQANVVSYLWNTGSTSGTLPISQTGLYKVTATGVGGFCEAIDSVEWKLWFEPTIYFKEGDDTSFCSNDVITLDPIEQSAFPITYLWNDNSNQSFLNINHVGLYWVEAQDENCAIRDSIIVNLYPELDVTLGEDIFTCDGKLNTLTPVTTIPVNNYTWSDGSTNSTLKIDRSGTYKVNVDNNLCYASASINVFYFKYPEFSLGNDTSLCPDSEISFDITAPFEDMEYFWSNGSRTPTQTLPAKHGVTYWVKATNKVCETTDSIHVKVRSVPNNFIGNDTAICEGSDLKLSVLNDDRIKGYEWNTEETKQSITVQDTGVYSVLIKDEFCTTPGKIHVTYKNNPTLANVELDAPVTICLGNLINFDVNDNRFTAYEWQDGSSSSRFTVQQEGIYWVKATHDCGVLSDTAIIEPCECPIWLPTAFNPNGDELNDTFIPHTECIFKKYKFAVYDRWGEEMFASEDPAKSWDGTFKSEKCSTGVYIWILTFTTIWEGAVVDKQINGNVTITR